MEDSARDPNNQRPKREYPARNPGYQPRPRPKRGGQRGGQPGNQNARKRGLYDRALTPEQLNALRSVRRATDLTAEISSLRIRVAAILTDPHSELDLQLRATRVLTQLLSAQRKSRFTRQRRG